MSDIIGNPQWILLFIRTFINSIQFSLLSILTTCRRGDYPCFPGTELQIYQNINSISNSNEGYTIENSKFRKKDKDKRGWSREREEERTRRSERKKEDDTDDKQLLV